MSMRSRKGRVLLLGRLERQMNEMVAEGAAIRSYLLLLHWCARVCACVLARSIVRRVEQHNTTVQPPVRRRAAVGIYCARMTKPYVTR
eukprot:6210176-Pleurochrysis_carterae.AAC.4